MRVLIAITMLACTTLVPSLSNADQRGVRDPGINARQRAQQARIQHGVRSGELTRREARNVREDQRDIRQLERAYKSDGKLTGAERRDLTHEQNQASREIHEEKHDGERR